MPDYDRHDRRAPSLVSDEGYEHYTWDEAKRQSAASHCPFCELILQIIEECKICGESRILRDSIIRVCGLTIGDVEVDGNPFRSGARLESLKLEIPMEPELNSNQESHHHTLGLVAFDGEFVGKYPGIRGFD